MTEAVKNKIRFWAWLTAALLACGVTIGQALMGVDTNSQKIVKLEDCRERIDKDITDLKVGQAKLEAIHRDVKKVQDQQDVILRELIKGRRNDS